MKKVLLPIVCFMAVFISCESDDNLDFDTIGQTFEIENVDFVSNNGFNASVNVVVPNNIDVFESDVPLVFVLDPEATATNNGLPVFEPLPRSFFFADGGFAQYRFNFIFDDNTGIFDLDLILESDNFDLLSNGFTQNQIFRIVIVPSSFAQNNDTSDLNTVLSKLNLD